MEADELPGHVPTAGAEAQEVDARRYLGAAGSGPDDVIATLEVR